MDKEEEEEEIVSEKIPQKHNLQRENSDFDMEVYMK